MEKFVFEDGVKMFNLITLIFYLDESMGKLGIFIFILLPCEFIWGWGNGCKYNLFSFGVLIMVEISMILYGFLVETTEFCEVLDVGGKLIRNFV